MSDIINRLEIQQGTTATHRLESRGHTISRFETMQGSAAAHQLESRGQASAGLKHRKAQ